MGEWVTIGVLVEKSPIRMSQSPSDLIEEEDDEESDEEEEAANSDSSQQQTQNKKRKRGGKGKQTNSRPRKFISFKFIDLGHGSYSSTSNSITSNVSSSGRNSLRGDSVLNLIMFEASRSSRGTSDNLGNRGGISETVYTGGSGGAFEKWAKETEGAVVAIVNPRILPLQKVSLVRDRYPLLEIEN